MSTILNPNTPTLDVSVITTCYGRNRHLYNLLSSLANSSVRPGEVIIVNDDADPRLLAQYPLNIVQVATSESSLNTPTSDDRSLINTENDEKTGFDIGRNRNLGAAKASYESLIFLDVDCLVATTFIEQLSAKLHGHSDALLMAQPLYLTRALTDDESLQLQQNQFGNAELNRLAVCNPYRHNLTDQAAECNLALSSALDDHNVTSTSIEQTQDYGAFWSLCFGIKRSQFERIGGFDTHYVGYGAEDTDFAFMARKLNIDFYLTSDVVYHQQHSVYRPPLNHLSSIVINANRFYDKWQHWPMGGWLSSFSQMQIIDWQAEKQSPITIIRKPTQHEIDDAYYPDAPYV